MIIIKLHEPYKNRCEVDRLNAVFKVCRCIGEYDTYYDGAVRLLCVEHAAMLVRLGKMFNQGINYPASLLDR